MKSSKTVSILILLSIFFTALCPGSISLATGIGTEVPAAGGYPLDGIQIHKYSSVENLKAKKKGGTYSISFQHLGTDMELTASFYRLEGAALYDGKVVGNVLASNAEVLYLAVSENKGPLDNIGAELGNDELLLHIVLLDAGTGKISDIGLVLKKSGYSALKKALKSSKVIDTDDELYGKLLHSGLWMKFYLPENRSVPQEFVWEEEIHSDVSLSLGDSELTAYVNTAAFVTPANAYGYGYWRGPGGEPVSFYIRDTFWTGDSYVTLLAVFRVRTIQVRGTDGFYSVHFEAIKYGDYLVEALADGTAAVLEAPSNMAYLVTKNPSMEIELMEGLGSGYIDLCSTTGTMLGSSGQGIGGFWKKVSVLLYPVVSTMKSIGDFFGKLARVLTGSGREAANPNPYRLSAKFTPAANPNAYFVACENNMYKRGAGLETNMYIEGYDAPEALKVQCRFGLMAVGAGYRHDLMEGGSIEISFEQ